MKKFLLSTAALAALTVAAPAFAQEESGVKLNLGGHFKGYGVWVDQETEAGDSVRDVDMVRETEVHFSGETTLDNGLTVGAHIEAEADQGDTFAVNESYAYFSGNWGRVNLGSEDGAAFLMQVAAPSADSNYDGVRQYVNPFNYSRTALSNTQSDALTGETNGTSGFSSGDGLDYDQNISGKNDKFTYLSPVFSGFQAGVSYTPDLGGSSRGLTGVTVDDDADTRGDAWDLAARYEGQFNAIDVVAGVGYSMADVESTTTPATVKDQEAWNAGLDLGFGAVGVGAVYATDDQGTANDEVETWVFGADYTTGPFVLGASYLTQDDTVGTDVETDRYTGGVTYAYGPGMTFRGSVSYVDHDIAGTSADVDGTAVMLGTQVNF